MLQALGRLAAAFGAGRPSEDDGRLWGRPALRIPARSGVPVIPAAVLQLDVVQAVLENIGGAISTLPVVVFRRLPDGSRVIDRDHPLHTLLNDRDGAGGVSVETNVAGLLRGDLTARYKAYGQGRLSVNEIRKLENMNSIGGDGDTYLQPKNMGDAADGPDDDSGSPRG